LATVNAKPYSYDLNRPTTALIVIDMQRDFIEPGGFGETLGNNIALLAAIVRRRLNDRDLPSARRALIHTREAHRADLSDCPPAKLKRGNPKLHIGDQGRDGAHPDRR